MWKGDKLWKTQFIGDDDEIPMRERDELWKCNSIGEVGEIPKWKRDKYGNASGFAFTTKFQRGKETIMEMQLKLHLQ